MNAVILIGGGIFLAVVLSWLAMQRLGIVVRSNNKQEAMKRSIERSLLHKLGGGGASSQELWIMFLLATVACIYKVVTINQFDLLALLDTLVTGCLVFVLANVVRLFVNTFRKRESASPVLPPVTEEKR
ncbi:MAG: hypothetical protein QM703_27275 [Gemmatales bacterium]